MMKYQFIKNAHTQPSTEYTASIFVLTAVKNAGFQGSSARAGYADIERRKQKMSVIRLKDGTQEFISDENSLINLIEEKLGRDISYELEFIFDDLRGELIDEDEIAEDIRREYEDEITELENNLDMIRDLADELISKLSKNNNQELLSQLRKIKNLAIV